MAAFYDTIRAPVFGDPILDSLIGATVYKSGYTVTYALAGKPGSKGMFNDGGTQWAANGARDAFRNAVAAWNEVSNLVIKPDPFYYAEGDSRSSFTTWVEKIGYLGADSPELGEHDLPSAYEQEGLFNSQHAVWSAANNAVGGYSFITFLHEIGHGLGLEHPHGETSFPGVTDPSSKGAFGLNQGLFTVMSYNDGYDRIGDSPSLAYGWMSTPGALDIAAIQAIYGANMTTRTGDDVYSLPGTNAPGTFFATIWDAGGIDTISAEDVTVGVTIDLRSATLKVEEGGGGFLSQASGIFGGFTIARGAQIENATGGSAADRLIGNEAANVLNGAAGEDTMAGLAGDDTYVVDNVRDIVIEEVGHGNDTIRSSVAYQLPSNVENLTLVGTNQISGKGNNGDNYLIGNGVNNVLNGGYGDDYLDGSTGFDTAVFEVLFRKAIVNVRSYDVFVGSAEGSDYTRSIERIQFQDGFFELGTDSAGAKVMRAYDTILGRSPDRTGLDFYVDQMEDRGMSLIGVVNDLSSSAEFQAATGGLSNRQFVDYVYQRALGRTADAAGANYYTQALNNGMSRGAFAVDLSESTEHRALTHDQVSQGYFSTDDTYQSVALLYDGFAGRLPDANGLIYYAERLKAGSLTLSQVVEDFAGSTEFKSATIGKTNGQIVDFIYQNTLDRSADSSGAKFYTDLMDRGATAAGVLLDVALSQEHYNLFASHIVYGIDLA